MEPGARGAFAQSNTPVIDLQQSTSQFKLDDNDERQQQKQQIMHGRHQQQRDNHSSQQEQFDQNQPKHPEQRQQHFDEQMVDIGTSAESNSFVLHLQQFTSQQQGENQSDWPKDNKHEQQQEQKKQQLKGELQRQQNQQEDDSNQQELFQQSQMQHPEQGQPHFDEQSDHLWPETLQVQHQHQKEEQEQHQHEEKHQYMQQSLQTYQQQQKEEQEQHQHEEKQQYMQHSLQTHRQKQQEEQEQHQHEEKHQYIQQSLQTHQQQQKEEQEQQQHEEKQQYMQQSLQTHQQQQKEEQEQHQHDEKQQYMQQSLQTHQQSHQQQLQPQVQQQHFNHQQSLQDAASGQNTSRSISFSYLVEMILPHLSREQADRVSARLLKFKRNEITKDDFVSGTRKVVGDQILVQTVKQIQKKATLATSSTATLHHTLSAFGGPISGGHSSGNLLQGQMCIQMPSLPPSSEVGSQINTSAKVPSFGQNNCYEATCPLNQLPRKKQKVPGDYLDQRVDPLNDVTAFSGINLREEEENLFVGSKDESCVAEAMRNTVQEEEERIFLEKGPLRAKIAGIMEKYGIKYISTDSERCLSLCIEEHLRAVIGQLIRLSKQRVDLERISHKVVLTSDVQHQILALNKKVKVDLEKKQAEEEEKLQKLYRTSMTENNASTEVEKDESHAKIQRAYKECNEMRSNAANAAVRAAIGGDDMLLKWQWMAEQAQQKRKGTMYQASNACTNRDVSRKNMAGRLEAGNVLDHLHAPSTGMIQNLGREYPSSRCTWTEPVHTICVKDVIALLERTSHMTKSTLLYRLYERDAECNKEKPFGN